MNVVWNWLIAEIILIFYFILMQNADILVPKYTYTVEYWHCATVQMKLVELFFCLYILHLFNGGAYLIYLQIWLEIGQSWVRAPLMVSAVSLSKKPYHHSIKYWLVPLTDRAWFHNRIKINWGVYGQLGYIVNNWQLTYSQAI